MPSIIQGYEYDIFISYRQKDNKHDGWVTEFVDNLKGELESTFKEEISVYFDINPHDGLLETYDVDASLIDKLKCLVFIPIISRTYCDPKSFAWEHEFKTFVEQASQDQFGLKVKLPNGNVANRVLPIQIHDLDTIDIKLCESILKGGLRSVDFIYKEQGFNRPLKPDDDEKFNLNKTKYRNQITKVSLGIKEIIHGLKAEPALLVKKTIQKDAILEKVDLLDRRLQNMKHFNFSRSKILYGVAITTILIIITAILTYPKVFKRDKLANLRSSDGRISIAIMPFQNMTNDTIWNVWQNGIQNNLITSLSTSAGLNVRQVESINGLLKSKGFTTYGSLTPSIASSFSQKLDARILIYGSITQATNIVRFNSQLIDSKTTELLKTFQIDGIPKNILNIVDSLSNMIANYLLISKLETEFPLSNKYYASTSSPEAYRYFMYGQKAMNQGDITTARNWFLQAISIDSNLITATLQIAQLYENEGNYDEAQKWCLKAYEKRDKMTLQNKLLTNIMYANLFETPNEMLNYWRQMIEVEDKVPLYWFLIGVNYCLVEQYDKAVPELEKALEIFKKWDSKPESFIYEQLLYAYHKSGLHKKEKELYNVAKQDTSEKLYYNFYQIGISLDEGDTIAAKRNYFEYLSSFKGKGYRNTDTVKYSPDEEFMSYMAYFYSATDSLDKAEKYYRKLFLLHPKEPWILSGLASILIDHDRNIEEGMVLINRAIELKPDKYLISSMLDTKGWGLYKQGKYKEALEILRKNWDLRMENHYGYKHSAYLHLEEVKKVTKWLDEQGKL